MHSMLAMKRQHLNRIFFMRRGEAVLITVSDRQGVFFTVQVFKKNMTFITAAEIFLQLNSLLCVNC